MGKTAKPLSILVMDEGLYQSDAVQALKKKGHLVHMAWGTKEEMPSYAYDVIIGPQCWRVEHGLGGLEAILEMVLKGVRAKRYGGKKVTK